jgi:hypothetical protein
MAPCEAASMAVEDHGPALIQRQLADKNYDTRPPDHPITRLGNVGRETLITTRTQCKVDAECGKQERESGGWGWGLGRGLRRRRCDRCRTHVAGAEADWDDEAILL